MKRSAIYLFLLILIAALACLLACATTNNADDDDDDDTTGDDDNVAIDTTIYEVQQGDFDEGTRVQLSHVIVTSQKTADGEGFFVQEPEGGPFSGVYIYINKGIVDEISVTIGDVLNLAGEYTEYYDFTEITIANTSDLEIVDSVDPLDPEVVDTADIEPTNEDAEQWEGVLVAIEDVTVEEAINNYGEFIADGVKVDDLFYGSAPNPPADTAFNVIAGLISFNFDEYKLCPRQAADYDSDEWDALDPDTGGGGGEDATIYEVREGDYGPGDVVTVTGVVTSPLDFIGETFFLQDADGGQYSGVAVYMYSEVVEAYAADLEMGLELRVTAEVQDYWDLTELVVKDPADLEILGTTDIPDAEVIDAGDLGEPWESVLVQIDDVTVSGELNNHGEFTADSGGDSFIVDDLFFEQNHFEGLGIGDGDEFAFIRGIVYFGFGEFKLEPRTDNDLND
ncbi:MAG: hypothetical protein P9L99_04705 [Candidatus Lernaella stagnicola]|nr:hypothetical protein [Candidatus Lernaella stagnicola]